MDQNQNPFEVLGLDPRLIRQLKPRQLDQLITVTSRTLKSMFHPDQAGGGDIDRFLEINTASQVLNRVKNPEAFEEARKSFLRKAGRAKVSKLVLELEQARLVGMSALHAFADYLLKRAVRCLVPTVHHLVGYRIKILDRVLLIASPQHYTKNGSGVGFYNLEFTRKGNFYISPKGKSRKIYSRVPVGAIPLTAFQKFGGLEKFLAQGAESTPPQLLNTRDEMVEARDGAKSSGRLGSLKSTYQNMRRMRDYLQDNIKYEFGTLQMLKVVNVLTAEIQKDHVLISAVENERGTFFYAEGVILEIKPCA